MEYHQLQRLGPWAWWRPAVGMVGLLVSFLLLVPFAVLAAFMVGIAISGADLSSTVDRMVDTDHVTPLALAYLNVAIAAMIPVTWLLMRVLHGLRPRWLASVAPRIRWRWLGACFGLAVLSLLLTVIVSAVVPAQGDGTEISGSVNDFTSTTRDFLLVIVLLTPLQAAGEEYVFRGYLTQAFGGLTRSRWMAVLGPALLFALAHGAQDAPIFFDRFAFGVVAGLLVVLTGGLEAGLAMHVLNNFLAFGVALAFGDMATVLNPTSGSWWNIPVTLTQSLSFLGLTLLVARSTGLRTRSETPGSAAELEGPRPRV